MKKTLVLILKLIALTVLFFIFYMAGSALLGTTLTHEDPAMQQAALKAIPIVCLVDTLVLALVILRSNWNGWRLMLATSVSYYGVQTVMAQIEFGLFWAGPGHLSRHDQRTVPAIPADCVDLHPPGGADPG